MTKENTLVVNPLPSPTWNRLHMNETTVTLPPLDGPCKGDWSGAEVTAAPTPATVVSTGMGQEAEAAFASLELDRITAKANTHLLQRRDSFRAVRLNHIGHGDHTQQCAVIGKEQGRFPLLRQRSRLLFHIFRHRHPTTHIAETAAQQQFAVQRCL